MRRGLRQWRLSRQVRIVRAAHRNADAHGDTHARLNIHGDPDEDADACCDRGCYGHADAYADGAEHTHANAHGELHTDPDSDPEKEADAQAMRKYDARPPSGGTLIGVHGPRSRSVIARDDVALQILNSASRPKLVIPEDSG